MKLSLLDTDVLSEFLRGNSKVAAKVDEHLEEYGLLCKDAKKQLKKFADFVGQNRTGTA